MPALQAFFTNMSVRMPLHKKIITDENTITNAYNKVTINTS